MVVYYLKAQAELEGVTDLQPLDTPQSPFEYSFRIECTGCREVHPKPVSINRFETYDIERSSGAASFVFKCHSCKKEKTASIDRTKEKVTAEDKNKWVNVLVIDARGIDFVEFIPDGRFECVGAESGTVFEEVDLEDGEWYDYDDKAGAEVSVVDVKWDIARS